MVKVNLKNGTTLSFDFGTSDGRDGWAAFQNSTDNQTQITAISIHINKTLHTLTPPKGFARHAYYAEPLWNKARARVVGAVIYVHADDVQHRLVVYFNEPKLARTDIRQIGKARYLTGGRPLPLVHPEQ